MHKAAKLPDDYSCYFCNRKDVFVKVDGKQNRLSLHVGDKVFYFCETCFKEETKHFMKFTQTKKSLCDVCEKKIKNAFSAPTIICNGVFYICDDCYRRNIDLR